MRISNEHLKGMTLLSNVLMLSAIASVAVTTQLTCQNQIHCSCGSTNTSITVCIDEAESEKEACKKWSRCKSCQDGLDECLECEEGFEDPFCSMPKRQHVKSRPKRQYQQNWGYRSPPSTGRQESADHHCPNLNSPKHGSIRCVTSDIERTCIGRCIPGYSFEGHPPEETSITLTCHDGSWEPFEAFPVCKSEGHCELVVQNVGSFNCTIGMTGTRCDVRCDNRYAGRFQCYPGRGWATDLPHCVRPKQIEQSCRCEYGASCNARGHCVCPAGRTGTYCEEMVPARRRCPDPGFVENGFRTHSNGTASNRRQSFEEGQSVMFGCMSDDYSLQGNYFITCQEDGTWSQSLPRCIRPTTPPAPTPRCPDPGQVANADRLNSDGSPSVGVQQYRVGQSVVYTCHPGFALQSRSLISCLSSGRWSNRTPYCMPLTTVATPQSPVLRYCRDLGRITNGNRQPTVPPNRRGFPQGSWVEFSCNTGYDLVGQSTLYCRNSGDWSASSPSCRQRPPAAPDVDESVAYCLNPGSIANGQVVYYPSINSRRRGAPEQDNLDPEYPENSRLQYSCNRGFTLDGSATIVCEKPGIWSADVPTCKRSPISNIELRYCPNPGPIPNGRVVHTPSFTVRRGLVGRTTDVNDASEEQYPQGSVLQYTCNAGYKLEGSPRLMCSNSGSWSATKPTCTTEGDGDASCGNPGIVHDGRMTVIAPSGTPKLSEDEDAFPEGTRVVYSCDDGFRLEGTRTLRCQYTGWSDDAPKCQPDCGRSFMQASRKIIHGDATKSGEWPWVVAISVEENDFTRIICGGAVLNTRTVLTAAHCLEVADRFTLYFGKLYRRNKDDDDQVSVRKSTRLIIHEKFNSRTLDSDIGLVKFDPPINFTTRVQPICLPSAESTHRNIMTGRTGYVTGWGITERHLQADKLLLASLPVLTRDACAESYRSQNKTVNVTDNMFCAGFPNGQQSVCSGDSGSPLVFYDTAQGSYRVEGLVSFGVEGQCGLPGMYTIFTYVYRFHPWILQYRDQ